jgi:phosphotriesterase-related protein
MATVQTVTGPLDASELGTTLIHEHLRTRDEAVFVQWPDAETFGGLPERAIGAGDDYDAALEAARAAVELGVKTIVDPTAMFIGRDAAFMRRVAEATGLQVVACTGLYTYDHLPPFFVSRDPDQIADMFVADIETGIQGTGIQAAFIKCAADEPGVTENVEKVHRAAARASLRTGRPIMAHSRPASETGPRQVEIFEQEGVDPAKVQIAHCGDTTDVGYIERLLDRGVYVGLDRYGLELFLPYEQRQTTTLALLEGGHAERLFLSSDSCATIDWFPPAVATQMLEAGLVKDWNIRIVPERVVPELREAGIDEDQIETMLVRNPVAWLTAD